MSPSWCVVSILTNIQAIVNVFGYQSQNWELFIILGKGMNIEDCEGQQEDGLELYDEPPCSIFLMTGSQPMVKL